MSPALRFPVSSCALAGVVPLAVQGKPLERRRQGSCLLTDSEKRRLDLHLADLLSPHVVALPAPSVHCCFLRLSVKRHLSRCVRVWLKMQTHAFTHIHSLVSRGMKMVLPSTDNQEIDRKDSPETAAAHLSPKVRQDISLSRLARAYRRCSEGCSVRDREGKMKVDDVTGRREGERERKERRGIFTRFNQNFLAPTYPAFSVSSSPFFLSSSHSPPPPASLLSLPLLRSSLSRSVV